MNNDKAKPVDVLFSSGVRQDLEPRTAPVGTLVNCDNLEFDQLNRLVRRDGYVQLGSSTFSKLNTIAFPVRRTAQTPRGERMLFTDANAHLHFPSVDKMSEAGLSSQRSTERVTLERVTGIAADETGTILFADCAASGRFVVYAYVLLLAGSSVLFVDVVDSVTGDRAISQATIGSSGSSQPRVVISGGSSIAFVVYRDGTDLRQSRIDLGASTLTVGASTLLKNDSSSNAFDVAPMTSGWVLVYRRLSGGTNKAEIVTYDSTPTVQNSFTWLANAGADPWSPSVLAIHGDLPAGATVRATGYDPTTFFMESVVLSSTLAVSTRGRMDPGLDHAKPAVQLTMSPRDTSTSLVLFSNYTSATVSTNPRGHLHTYQMAASAALTVKYVFANYSLASKIYRDTRNAYLYALARFDDPSGFQSHFLVLDFDNVAAAPTPALHFASGRVPLSADNAVTCIGGVADLSSVTPGSFQFFIPLNIGSSQLSGNQVTAYSMQSLGTRRFLSTPCQGQAIIGGGTPLAYDGQRLVELSFYSYPILQSGNIVLAAAGGSMPQGIFQYRAVYEWTDAAGNRHQSPASPEITADMSSATYVAGTNKVTLTFPAYHPTRKQVPVERFGSLPDSGAPIRVVVYRTIAGGQVFYRMATTAANNVNSAADDTAIADTFTDAAISVNEVLYTQAGGRGELATTAPPPTVLMTAHAQRLWGIDGENPERIWCTKTLSEFVSPGYNQGLQVTIPGAGKINGIAGQDGKLYALATNGVYLASYGDGPDNAGGGVFPSPQLVTIAANCTEPRSVLIATTGIFFVGKDQWGIGIYVIQRGDANSLSIGKRVRTELATNPVCRGAVDRVDKSRVEFLFVNSDVTPTTSVVLYYHYDYIDQEGMGQWTVARVTSAAGAPMESLGIWDDISVISDTTAAAGIQTVGTLADFATTTPVIRVTTTDVRPFGLVGYGQIASVSVFGTAINTDPLFVEASYNGGLTWPDTFTFTPGIDSAGGPVLRRWETATQKLPDGGSVRIRLSDPTNGGNGPGSSYFHGLSLQFMPIGGNARLGDERRG